MRIRWTTTVAVVVGVLSLAAGVAGRPVHAASASRPAAVVKAAGHSHAAR
jgi:hypothetical protein